MVTWVIFGLAPALRATKVELVADLRGHSQASGGLRRYGIRDALVVSQVAICTVLLVATGLFVRSLYTTRGMDFGLRNRNLLLVPFDPALDHRSDVQSRQLLREILQRARGIPGVETVTLTTEVPLTFIVNNSRFVAAEKAADRRAGRVGTDIYTVGPEFFSTLGMSLLTGDQAEIRSMFERRASALDDASGQPVFRPAIVNDAFARAAFPNESPVGRRIVGDGKTLDVVGVVETVKSRTIGEGARPSIYLPILTEYVSAQSPRGVTLVVKTRDEAASYAETVREMIRGADPSLAVFDVRTMETHLRDALIVPRLTSTLSAVAGTIGLVLATVGVYGVISFAVARRRRELGIRLAVGARPREVLAMILRQGLTLASIGIGLGLAVALGVTRFAASLLYGVGATDPWTFLVVSGVLIAAASAACLLPARAAARLDPVDVLRSE
jgi:predicted permease